MYKNNFVKQLLTEALRQPIARVDRSEYLGRVLRPYCGHLTPQQLQQVRPEEMLDRTLLDELARREISRYEQRTALFSASASLASRWTLWIGVPYDLVQYYACLISLAQKLAYLYGWDDFHRVGAPTEETYTRYILLIGYAMGVAETRSPLLRLIPGVQSRFSDMELPGWQKPVTKQATTQLLWQLGRSFLSGWIAKRWNILGCTHSGLTTLYYFRTYATRIQLILREGMLLRQEAAQPQQWQT